MQMKLFETGACSKPLILQKLIPETSRPFIAYSTQVVGDQMSPGFSRDSDHNPAGVQWLSGGHSRLRKHTRRLRVQDPLVCCRDLPRKSQPCF